MSPSPFVPPAWPVISLLASPTERGAIEHGPSNRSRHSTQRESAGIDLRARRGVASDCVVLAEPRWLHRDCRSMTRISCDGGWRARRAWRTAQRRTPSDLPHGSNWSQSCPLFAPQCGGSPFAGIDFLFARPAPPPMRRIRTVLREQQDVVDPVVTVQPSPLSGAGEGTRQRRAVSIPNLGAGCRSRKLARASTGTGARRQPRTRAALQRSRALRARAGRAPLRP